MDGEGGIRAFHQNSVVRTVVEKCIQNTTEGIMDMNTNSRMSSQLDKGPGGLSRFFLIYILRRGKGGRCNREEYLQEKRREMQERKRFAIRVI
ncbi:hypothetical protein JCM21714_812 [Gracilibacillus boraciitolerans JCM 21714]|uniref:Uncharacterized protein n=1 Tax=Gracilibacillus boraciitolerans JCM 21714 TaxID=1298598 RepID=W4VGA8_9BACI|nr:hypothetical protein JCM21714_812 [Gracilibacillus boraciitolerans JCM 21714]